jgi:hypothetical protein
MEKYCQWSWCLLLAQYCLAKAAWPFESICADVCDSIELNTATCVNNILIELLLHLLRVGGE